MKNKLKELSVGSAIEGMLIGYFSPWYILINVLFLVFSLQSRGTREWEEDSMFVPVLIVLLGIWLVILCVEIGRRIKNKNKLLSFIAFTALFAIVAGVRIYMFRTVEDAAFRDTMKYIFFLP